MFFDVHCHLTHEAFKNDLPDVIKRAKDVTIHCAGSGLHDNEKVLEISRQYGNVKASLGLYPWDAVELSEGETGVVFDQMRKHKDEIICIGEVGLDHYWGKSEADWQKQEWVFSRILDLANELGKPVLVHTRKAEKESLEMIEGREKIIIHSYTGPQKLVPEFLEQGCYFSIPAVLLRSGSFQSLVKKVPVNRLLTETDAPYLPPKSGERSEPSFVKLTVKKMAEIKGLSEKEVEDALTQNYKAIFIS